MGCGSCASCQLLNSLYTDILSWLHTSYLTLSSGIRGMSHESLVFSWYTNAEPLGECVYQGNISNPRNIPRHTTRKGCIAILNHDIEIYSDQQAVIKAQTTIDRNWRES